MSRDDWPTLGEMIESGKRVVIFMDKGADEPVVNFILPQFKMVRPLALPKFPSFPAYGFRSSNIRAFPN